MTQAAASRLPRAERMAGILRAARAVFREKGYADASVAEIAARAGVVEGSVYRYFEHKRALLVEVVETWYEEMLSDYDAHVVRIEGTWERLRYMVWRHLSSIAREPELVRLVFGELRPGADYRTTRVFGLNRAYTQRTLAILRDGIARGEIRADAPLTLARDMIYGGIEHHTWAFLRGEGAFSADVAADGIMSILRAGLEAKEKAPVKTELAAAVRRLEAVVGRLDPKPKKKTRSYVPKGPRRQPR